MLGNVCTTPHAPQALPTQDGGRAVDGVLQGRKRAAESAGFRSYQLLGQLCCGSVWATPEVMLEVHDDIPLALLTQDGAVAVDVDRFLRKRRCAHVWITTLAGLHKQWKH
jgi:hypothetical protein